MVFKEILKIISLIKLAAVLIEVFEVLRLDLLACNVGIEQHY